MLNDLTGTPIILSEADTRIAQRTRKALTRLSLESLPEQLHLTDLPKDVLIPRAVMPLISQMLEAVGNGEQVRVLVEKREVTPHQAAALLGVSRPFFMQILKQGLIPSRKVGSHYRLLYQDVLAYQQEKQRRTELLNQITREAQEEDMGY